MEALGAPEKSHRAMYLCTCFKLAGSLQALKDPEAETWLQRIWAMREAVTAACEQDPGEYAGALSALVDTGLHFFRRAMGRDGQAALEYVEKVLELLERCHACPDNWSAWFEALSNHAFLTEERDLQASAREYRRALNLARDHHLDRFPFSAIAVAMQNFNYGWVLWNRMDSPEAVLYFARAIDLLESYLSTGVADRETVLRDLKKVGEALDEVYADTGRDEESARLRERLAENGVRLE